MQRVSTALLAVVLFTGCENLGLDAAPIPLDEARHAAPPELVATVHADGEGPGELVVDGRLWVPWGLPVEHDAAALRPVGSTRGLTVYARIWDRAPYDALLTATPAAWQPHAPILGGSGPAAGH